MPLEDDRGLALSTACVVARDAYCEGVAQLLSARPGAERALQDAVAADPTFALAHVALARCHQAHARTAQAREALARAMDRVQGLPPRERSHVHALRSVVLGDAAAALRAIREHLDLWPRDVMVMAPCAGVFGLFGFSGVAGREQALRDFLEPFATSLAHDWWFLATRAFARCETGDIALARRDVEASLALAPDNANGAHVFAHVLYESRAHAAARAWLAQWLPGYPPHGLLHGHLHWHVALAALEMGDPEGARSVLRQHIAPGASWGPPINLISDNTSLLLRARLHGEPVAPQDWQALAALAGELYPRPGVAFADVHVAIALAMVDDREGLERLRAGASGPAADVVVALANAFEAFAHDDPAGCFAALAPVLSTHERIGGSRAQRDLIEQLAQAAITRGALKADWRPRHPFAAPPR